MSYFYIFLIVIAGIMTANYVHGLIFTIFKADQYEDTLMLKLRQAIREELDRE